MATKPLRDDGMFLPPSNRFPLEHNFDNFPMMIAIIGKMMTSIAIPTVFDLVSYERNDLSLKHNNFISLYETTGPLAKTLELKYIIAISRDKQMYYIHYTSSSVYVTLRDGIQVIPVTRPWNQQAFHNGKPIANPLELAKFCYDTLLSEKLQTPLGLTQFNKLYNRLGQQDSYALLPTVGEEIYFKLVGDDEFRIGYAIEIELAGKKKLFIMEHRGASYSTYPIQRLKLWRPY